MTGKDEILNRACRKFMVKWDLVEFKSSHPSLHRSIMEAMNDYAVIAAQTIQTKKKVTLNKITSCNHILEKVVGNSYRCKICGEPITLT